MPSGTTYRMRFANVEGIPVEVNIYDRMSEANGPFPYNIRYEVIGIVDGGINKQVRFTFDPLEPDTEKVRIEYGIDGSPSLGWQEFSPTSPIVLVVPNLELHFIFFLFRENQVDDYDMNNTYPQVIDVVPAGECLTISVTDNDQDKGGVIRAKQCVIQFMSDQNVSMSTFMPDQPLDDRYYVEVLIANKIEFKGYLILDDLAEPFLDPSNIVTLTATDRLGTIKDVDLVNSDGVNPRGKARIIDFLVWALRKTGLSLPINVIMSVREVGMVPFVTNATFISIGNRIIAANNPMWIVGRTITILGGPNNNVTGKIVLVDGPIAVGPNAGKYNIYLDVRIVDGAGVATFRTDTTHFFDQMYLDAKTFEKEINVSEDCYSVIQKILGEYCMITQEHGAWWIVAIDERDAAQATVATFDESGKFVKYLPADLYEITVGRGMDIWHAGKSTEVQPIRPHAFAKETYEFVNPREIICNGSFERGVAWPELDINNPSGNGYPFYDFNNDGKDDDEWDVAKAYRLDCWTIGVFRNNGRPPLPTTMVNYIRRVYYRSYEKDRFVVLEPAPGQSPVTETRIKSDAVRVYAGDIVDFSVAFRYYKPGFDPGIGSIATPAVIELVGDNGQYYYMFKPDLASEKGIWFQYPNLPAMVSLQYNYETQGGNFYDWATLNVKSDAVPITGNIFIYLQSFNVKPPTISITSFVNGSYDRYKGVYYKNSQEGYTAKREKNIFINTANRELYKGALFIKNGDKFQLASSFYNHFLTPNPQPGNLKDFGNIICDAMWNQHNKVFRTFRAALFGLNSGGILPGIVRNYIMNDRSSHSYGKYFMILGYEQNIKDCTWTATLKEVRDVAIDREYPATEIKYIEES